MERSQSVKNINIAILDAQGEFPIIDKSAINPFYKSKYAPYDGIMKFIRPIIVKNKLLIEHSVKISNEEINAVVNVKEKSESIQIISIPLVSVTTRVTHAGSEEWKEVMMEMPAEKGNSHGIQAVITYIKRNNLILLLDIVVGDEDDDANDSVTPDSDRNFQRPRGNDQRPRTNPAPQDSIDVKKEAATVNVANNQKRDLEKDILDVPQQEIKQDPPKDPIKENPGSLRELNQNIKNAERQTTAQAGAPMTDTQRSRAGVLIGEEYDKMKSELESLKALGMSASSWKEWLKKNYEVDSIQLIKRKDFEAIMETIKMDPCSIDANIKLGGN